MRVILTNSTIYFRVVEKPFDLPLSAGYDVSWPKIVLKVLDKFFSHKRYQTS